MSGMLGMGNFIPRTFSGLVVGDPMGLGGEGKDPNLMHASTSIGLSQHFDAKAVSASALFWWCCYMMSKACLPLSRTYRLWNRSEQYQARSTVASTFFILVIVPLSAWALVSDQTLLHVKVVGSTPLSRAIIHLATGYFLYDSLLVLLHLRQDGHSLQFLAHGVLCLITYGLAAMFDCYQYYGPVFLMFEVTSLFINARWWLAKLEMRESILYAVNGFTLIFAWLCVRLIFGLTQSASFWSDTIAHASDIPPPIMLWYTFSNVCLNSLNIFWFAKIMKSALSWGKSTRKKTS